MKPNELTKQRN